MADHVHVESTLKGYLTTIFIHIIHTDHTQTKQQLGKIGLSDNPAYEVCQQRARIDTSNNPAYEQRAIDLSSNLAYEVGQQRTHLTNLTEQEPEYMYIDDNDPLYEIMDTQD